LFCTAAIESPSDSDRSICSYSCSLLVNDSKPLGHIYSPGFMANVKYSPYSSCEWILIGKPVAYLSLYKLLVTASLTSSTVLTGVQVTKKRLP